MKDLTDEQIADLAKAYPNQPTGNAYLEYYNSNLKETDQNFSLGTWANLNALRKLGKVEFLPLRFRTNARRKVTAPIVTKQRTVDLSAKEVEGAEGLKSHTVTSDDIKANPDLVEHVKVGDKIGIPSPELIEAEKELAQLKKDKAHHMTIKSAQAKVDELEKDSTLRASK